MNGYQRLFSGRSQDSEPTMCSTKDENILEEEGYGTERKSCNRNETADAGSEELNSHERQRGSMSRYALIVSASKLEYNRS